MTEVKRDEFFKETSQPEKESVGGAVMMVEGSFDSVVAVCRKEVGAGQSVVGCWDWIQPLEQALGLLQPALVQVKSWLAKLVTNIKTIMVQVEADELAREGGWMGVMCGADVPGDVD